MALQKQPVSLTFASGLDLKTDPFQVPIGKFTSLVNSVFTTTGRLTKRNGFANITALPDRLQSALNTLNDNLIATGSNLYAFSADTNMWLNQGLVQPVQLSVQPLVRVSTSQQSPDTAITPEGLACLAYADNGVAYYQVSDSNTGQQIVTRTNLPATATNPRVFLLGSYFVITFIATVAATPTLQAVALPTATPNMPTSVITISADVSSLTAGYDGYVINNTLYLAWAGSASTVNVARLFPNLTVSPGGPVASGASTTLVSVTADTQSQMIWVSYWDSITTNGFSAGFSYLFTPLVPSLAIIVGKIISELTSVASKVLANSVLSIFYENINNYSYVGQLSVAAIRTDFISTLTVTAPSVGGAGAASATTVMLRSVGLASKAFTQYTYTLPGAPYTQVTGLLLPANAILVRSTIYMLVEYGDITQIDSRDNSNQPTYFLVDSTGAIYMRLAYANAGGYEPSQVLPSVSQVGNKYLIPYLITDFLTTVNKGTALPTGTPVNAIYTQKGINLAEFSINATGQLSSEIAGALHLTGGQLWEYDGVKPVEHGFHVWPENIAITTSTAGGLITAQTYNYVFAYEWTDNQGMLHRSAPSIPTTIVTTGATSTNTIKVPTLRLTYKQPFISPPNPLVKNPIRIVGYRWSTAQQVYYQFTSITSPVINDTTIDSVTITDTNADLSILGQTLLYTTGGVIENIAAPASSASALFKNRLFLIDAEDPNLLWFSKQVVQSTPVEMSDLLTLFIAPTTGAQGSTGPMTALSAMDDKLIIFKRDAIYYLTGTGPDNTGAQNDFSDPIFITGTVGCSNPSSIVLIPNGLMFQSDKGIWLLGRDLTTQYIGQGVELYNSQTVMSATAIPATNQARFVLNDSITLMYDYFVGQWGTHTNINALSATLHQNTHTYLNGFGQVFQESAGSYVDGSEAVLMSLTTSWINVAGIQGYERFYFADLLGTYYTPFTLNVQFAYDYNPSATQAVTVRPDNFAAPWGGEAQWGSGAPWGGPGNVFEARVYPSTQKCESFQVTIQEVYDQTFGIEPGAGLTLSGMNLIIGMKKGYRSSKASKSFG